jgi:hypothetical protein
MIPIQLSMIDLMTFKNFSRYLSRSIALLLLIQSLVKISHEIKTAALQATCAVSQKPCLHITTTIKKSTSHQPSHSLSLATKQQGSLFNTQINYHNTMDLDNQPNITEGTTVNSANTHGANKGASGDNKQHK